MPSDDTTDQLPAAAPSSVPAASAEAPTDPQPVTLYDRSGRELHLTGRVPGQVNRYLTSGYTTEKPFLPANHTAAEVKAYLAEHPADAARVRRLEVAGDNRTTALN